MSLQQHSVSAIVLAGGKSSRMGRDKGLLPYRGKPMAGHVLDILSHITRDIIIVTNQPEYEKFGYELHEDIIRECGPAGGIYTGLKYTRSIKNIVVSCDTPCINEGLLHYLLSLCRGNEITVPLHEENVHPLCGIYDAGCAGKLELLIKSGKRKMNEIILQFKLNVVPVTPGMPFYNESLFLNINTKEELQTGTVKECEEKKLVK